MTVDRILDPKALGPTLCRRESSAEQVEASALVRDLACLKAREAPFVLRAAAKQAWSRRWWGLLSVGTQRAVAEALQKQLVTHNLT